MSQKTDSRQIKVVQAQPMVGSDANEILSSFISKANGKLETLFEAKQILIESGGLITVNSDASEITFASNTTVHINSLVGGGSPVTINLGNLSTTLSNDGNMIFVILDRSDDTAMVFKDVELLPDVVSATQYMFLIAKKVGNDVVFRNDFRILGGTSVLLGSSGVTGSVSTTENTLVKSKGTLGKEVQGTSIVVDSSNNISTPGSIYSGSSTKSESAVFQVDSTEKGILIPRMTSTQRDAIVSPDTSLMIFNTTDEVFNYFNGTSWEVVGGVERDVQITIDPFDPTIDWSKGSTFYYSASAGFTLMNTNSKNGQVISAIITNTSGADFDISISGIKKRSDFDVTIKANSSSVFTFVKSNNVIYAACVPGMT